MYEYILLAIILILIILLVYLLKIKKLVGISSSKSADTQKNSVDSDYYFKNYISKTEFLKRISMSLTHFFEYKNIMKNLTTEIGKYFNTDRCCFLEYNITDKHIYHEQDPNQCYAREGLEDCPHLGASFLPIENDLKRIMEEKKFFSIEDISKYEGNINLREFFKKSGTCSIVIIPLLYRNRPEGFFVLSTVNKKIILSQEDNDLLSTLAALSSVIIHQAKLYQNLKKSQNKEILARNIINKILASNDFNEAVTTAVRELAIFLGVNRGLIRFYDPQYNFFQEIVGEYSKNNLYLLKEIKYSVPKEINDFYLSKVFKNNDLLVVNDVEALDFPEALQKRFKTYNAQSLIVMGLRYQNKPLAVMIFDINKKIIWSKDKIDFLTFIQPQVAACMSVYYMNQRFYKVSEIEKSIIKLITKFRQLNDPGDINKYLLQSLVEVMNCDGAIQFTMDRNVNIYTKNKFCDDKYESVNVNEDPNYQEQINFFVKNKLTVVNDVAEEILDEKFKQILKDEGIMSFTSHFSSIRMAEDTPTKETWLIILYNKQRRLWSSEIADAIRLIIDTLSLIYIDLIQQREIDETKQNFIATLTHDLKSPIIAEQKALEAIMMANPETPIGKYLEYLKDIHKMNDGQLKMIQNLLSVYHFERGGYKFEFGANDIAGLLYESVRFLKYIASDRKCEIKTDVGQNLPPVNIDREEIRRVLVNLINNAIVHTNEGTQIIIDINQKDEDFILIAIADNGEGIPEANKPKIFNKFQSKKSKVGAGLGLYLSKQIVEAHKGQIWFESTEGKGTTFFFTVPIYKQVD